MYCILPGVIHIGGKLRHPFRLYANNNGNICVIVCDAPITIIGIHSVLNGITKWSRKNGVTQIIVLEGIGEVATTTGMGMREDSKKRKPLVLSSDGNAADDGSFLKRIDKDNNSGINTTFVAGISGGLLASCLSSRISCKGLLIQTPSAIPDPEGAAILLEALNTISKDLIKIDTQQLKQRGENLKRNMEEVIKSIYKQQQEQQSPINGGQRMYT